MAAARSYPDNVTLTYAHAGVLIAAHEVFDSAALAAFTGGYEVFCEAVNRSTNSYLDLYRKVNSPRSEAEKTDHMGGDETTIASMIAAASILRFETACLTYLTDGDPTAEQANGARSGVAGRRASNRLSKPNASFDKYGNMRDVVAARGCRIATALLTRRLSKLRPEQLEESDAGKAVHAAGQVVFALASDETVMNHATRLVKVADTPEVTAHFGSSPIVEGKSDGENAGAIVLAAVSTHGDQSDIGEITPKVESSMINIESVLGTAFALSTSLEGTGL